MTPWMMHFASRKRKHHYSPNSDNDNDDDFSLGFTFLSLIAIDAYFLGIAGSGILDFIINFCEKIVLKACEFNMVLGFAAKLTEILVVFGVTLGSFAFIPAILSGLGKGLSKLVSSLKRKIKKIKTRKELDALDNYNAKELTISNNEIENENIIYKVNSSIKTKIKPNYSFNHDSLNSFKEKNFVMKEINDEVINNEHVEIKKNNDELLNNTYIKKLKK